MNTTIEKILGAVGAIGAMILACAYIIASAFVGLNILSAVGFGTSYSFFGVIIASIVGAPVVGIVLMMLFSIVYVLFDNLHHHRKKSSTVTFPESPKYGHEKVSSKEHEAELNEYFKQYKQAVKIRDLDMQADYLLCIGMNYRQDGQADTALKYYWHAVQAAKGANNKDLEKTVRFEIASIYQEQESYSDITLKNIEEALQLSIEINDKVSEAITNEGIAKIYKQRGELDLYRKYLEMAKAAIMQTDGKYERLEESIRKSIDKSLDEINNN